MAPPKSARAAVSKRSFFMKKGKKPYSKNTKGSTKSVPKAENIRKKVDEEIVSSDDDEVKSVTSESSQSSEESDYGPAQKLRKVKELLKSVEGDSLDELLEEEDVGKESKSKIVRPKNILQSLAVNTSPTLTRVVKGHRLPLTAAVLSYDKNYVYSASKDGSILKYSLAESKVISKFATGKKLTPVDSASLHHAGSVLCLAISTDGEYLASGGSDKMIVIWSTKDSKAVHVFKGHKKAITGLVFRKGTRQLFSCSLDRNVKHWSVDERAYIETLFGHEDGVPSIDCLYKERPVTAGGRDNTVRIWKIVEESQLVFNGLGGSIDCVSFVSDDLFITGSDSGSVSLWSCLKKKPLFTIPKAHGPSRNENWISSTASLDGSDLLATGSNDGFVKLWKVNKTAKKIEAVTSIEVAGFVNGLQFSADGALLVVAVGQEHRLGRWWRHTDSKNSVLIFSLTSDN